METEEEEHHVDRDIKQPPRVGSRSRSFFTIPDKYKDLAMRAASLVRFYTLFKNLMLDAKLLDQLLTESWNTAQKELQKSLDRDKVLDAHVYTPHAMFRVG